MKSALVSDQAQRSATTQVRERGRRAESLFDSSISNYFKVYSKAALDL